MKSMRTVSLFLLVLAAALPARAEESGNFVVQLGQDTVGVEHYARAANRLEVDQVGRAPRTLRRHFIYDYADGAITKFSMVVTPPGATTPTQSIDATFDTDSMRAQIKTGIAPVRNLNVAMPRGTLVVAGSSPWAGYESQIMRLVRAKSDTLGGTFYLMGSDVLDHFHLRKLGRDSVEISNTHMDVYRARVDKTGHILGTLPVAGTQKVGITRVATLDVDAMATNYMAREQAGAGVGMLSPRDTVRVASAGGDTLMIDYSRPAKRGRTVFGGILVPYGEVWRTGANAATQFRTNRALDFGGTLVPAGFYTLWTMPSAGGIKLVVNSETGQWGTAHKADKDLFSIDMKLSTLPQVVERFTISVESSPQGGVLNLDWDTTRASAAFTTHPAN